MQSNGVRRKTYTRETNVQLYTLSRWNGRMSINSCKYVTYTLRRHRTSQHCAMLRVLSHPLLICLPKIRTASRRPLNSGSNTHTHSLTPIKATPSRSFCVLSYQHTSRRMWIPTTLLPSYIVCSRNDYAGVSAGLRYSSSVPKILRLSNKVHRNSQIVTSHGGKAINEDLNLRPTMMRVSHLIGRCGMKNVVCLWNSMLVRLWNSTTETMWVTQIRQGQSNRQNMFSFNK